MPRPSPATARHLAKNAPTATCSPPARAGSFRAAFEQRDFAAAIAALEPIAGELERIGGSRAQLDLVEFTLLQAYAGANRPDDARRMLSLRRRGRLARTCK